MKVDPQEFMENGCLILRNVVPLDRLQELRLTVELMVDYEKRQSVARRGDGDPLGGAWYVDPQPRLKVSSIQKETASIMDFCLGETTLGVAEQIMPAPEVSLNGFNVLCSGIIDYGYTDWHRDISSMAMAPLGGLQTDLLANRPGYVQWNIALYEDDVFWVLPKSHAQPTTEAQRRQLLIDPEVELEGGMAVELGPGDGIVYTNMMMHWGSKYTSKIRRTIHPGYRTCGGNILPYTHQLDWYHEHGLLDRLSDNARSKLKRSATAFETECDDVEATLRALIDADEAAFRERLAGLHPGEHGRMTAVVLLCRLASKIVLMHRPDIAQMSPDERRPLIDDSPPAGYLELMGYRFTADDAARLQERFAALDERLNKNSLAVYERYTKVHAELVPEATDPPDFASRPLRTFDHDMPEGFDVDEFIASW